MPICFQSLGLFKCLQAGHSAFSKHNCSVNMSLIFCALLAVALAEDPLRAVMKSPKAALNLYSSFKADNHLAFAAGEDRMRFKLFLKSAEQVADFNEDPTDTAHYVLNMFSSMTEEKTKQYEGVNATEAVA